MDDQPRDHVIYLDPPLKFADKTVTEFVIREPNTGQVDRAFAYADGTSQGLVKFYSSLIQEVSGLSKALVSLIPYSQYRESVHYLDLFMHYSPVTGENSDTI
jgi:hypothetical protein